MEDGNANPMALSSDDFREIDRSLLDRLAGGRVTLAEGRVTLVYARERIATVGHHIVTATSIG